MLSIRPPSSLPLSSITPELDASTPSAASVLAANAEKARIFLLEAEPFDEDAERTVTGLPHPVASRPLSSSASFTVMGGTRALRYADREFHSGAADDPAHTSWNHRLGGTLTLDSQGFSGPEPSGTAARNDGEVTIQNGDGDEDGVAEYDWAGRRVELLVGVDGFARSQFVTINRATVSSVVVDPASIRLQLRDRRQSLDVPVQQNLYGGTGGADGDSDLAGRPKPLTFGRVRNVSPVAVSRASLIYQVHEGRVGAIDDVRDRGASLNFDADYSDYAALAGATVASGEYATCLAEGLIRLGGTPDGTVTADVEGDAPSGTGISAGYVFRTADIVRRVLLRSGNLRDPEEISGAAFTEFNSRFGGTVGIWIDAPESCLSVASRLLAAAGGWLAFTRAGKAAVYRLRAPVNPKGEVDGSKIITLDRATRGQRSFERRVGWRRMWTVQGDDDLAGSVSDANRQLYANEYRFSVSEAPAAAAASALAQSVATETFLDGESDADALAAEMKTLHAPRRDVWTVTARDLLFTYWHGDVVTLTDSRFGLSAGKDLVVIGIVEDYARGETRLTLWG